MQTCYNCGKQVDDNVLICPECGALVKRYGKPERPDEAASGASSAPSGAQTYPGAYDTPAAAAPRGVVWQDDAGRPHFRGNICFWLVVCAIFAGYMCFGFGSMLLIYRYQDFFLETMQLPEFSDILSILQSMIASVEMLYPFYLTVLVLFALKFAGYIWFLASHRRLAFYCTAAISALLVLVTLIFGGSLQALIYLLDPALTYLFLRRGWQVLKR